MKDDRLRVPIDGPYLHAVGLAMICFARLEWQAVWCSEKIRPGYIRSVRRKTAGQIAHDLIAHSDNHSDPAVACSLGQAAAEFKRLVDVRNDIMHASLGTSPAGEQRLFRDGMEWTIPLIDDAADAFVACGGVLNHHFYNVL